MKRSLHLAKDTLVELTSGDLADVRGGDAPVPSYGDGLVTCILRGASWHPDCMYTLPC